MDIRQGTRFFLGANSPDGFCSLFDDFVSVDNGDFLWIIKGGPGCGKSGFMKKIGEAAEKAGHLVEYIGCALDPDSLDGVYLPELRTGYVDGTAPHVIETYNTGAASMCLDLGAFYDVSGLKSRLAELRELEERYIGEMGRMRALTAAAGAVNPRKLPGLRTSESEKAATRRVAGVVSREFGKGPAQKEPGGIRKRFVSTFTAQGDLFLEDTVNKLCSKVYTLDNDFGLAPVYLSCIMEAAIAKGYSLILCPDPMEPEEPEAIFIPGLSLGFISISSRRKYSGEAYRHVRLDALIPADTVRAMRPRYRAATRLYNEILRVAMESIETVKSAHDAVENLYRPYVNFEAINAVARDHIRVLFG